MADAANWVSAFVAIGAFVTSVAAYRSAAKSQATSAELARRNAEMVERQTNLEHQAWADEYFREITHWACEVCTAISTAIHVVDGVDQDRKLSALITLSACIDMGRWYFPNRYHDEEGHEKEPAYRGIRQPVLDWIVRAYDILGGRIEATSSRGALIECQRQFVSCIQQRLDPRSREKMVSRILLDYLDVDKLSAVGSPK
jgi:hypothetical protein